MTYETALDAPYRRQWDPDSRLPLPDPGTAPGNCGVTCVAMAAQFYTEKWTGIFAIRRQVLGYNLKLSTSIGEQREMLRRQGVESVISQPSLASIRELVKTGRRPVLLGLDMSKVPAEIRGHAFTGWHAILIRANAGTSALLAADPNFNTTFRVDPTDGRRKYPNWVIQRAFNDAGGWALIPAEIKPLPRWQGRVVAEKGARIRFHPIEDPGSVFAIAEPDGYTHRPGGARLWANTYAYDWDGEIFRSNGIRWYRVRTHHGNVRFIRVGAATVKRPA